MSTTNSANPWQGARELLRAQGLRWTPQRRALIDVLAASHGHLSGAEILRRCRDVDPMTTPSTVYRTLDVLERLGLVRHAHGLDGGEEYHLLPRDEHGHLFCWSCGSRWELAADEAKGLVGSLHETRGFEVDLSHVTVVGTCSGCAHDQDAQDQLLPAARVGRDRA